MSTIDTDRDVLEETWERYTEEFGEYVGSVVTPYDYVETEQQVEWAARIFMFGYGLGSIAGANAVAPDTIPGDVDEDRVADVVDTVVDIHASEEFAVSNAQVVADFLE